MSIKAINGLTHFTDYVIGHVHGGALGWNGFLAFGMIYYLMPKLWGVPVYSKRLMMTHFWTATIGIVLYITSMWTAGITQGLMWRAFTEDGLLKYPEFIETVVRLIPFYWVRVLGGVLYLLGMILMVYNVVQTVKASKAQGVDLSDPSFQVRPLSADPEDYHHSPNPWHRKLEGRPVTFALFVFLAVIIGGPVTYIPLVAVRSNIPTIASVKPYTPLELEGRDIYVREGCYTCHSQMVRPFRDEVVRYGEYSKAGEFVYDRPFQFGSKRTGPDLHRVGGKYNNFWHYRHMLDPRSTTPDSIMPSYSWLYDDDLDTSLTKKKIKAFKTMGAPYSEEEVNEANALLDAQAKKVTDQLVEEGVQAPPGLQKKEIIALIAYLQRLGTDIKVAAK